MNKIRTLLRMPIETQSGYGKHSYEIFKALNDDPIYDLHVESIRWGHCSYRTDEYPLKKQIKDCIAKYAFAKHQNQENWDLFISVSIPNEFERKGKFNIGVTAGAEVDRVSHVWIQKCNEMDLVVVPSEHSKKIIEDTVVEWFNQKTQERGEFKLQKPIVVCHEGVDTDVFNNRNELSKVDNKISSLKFDADFNFLHVGQWGPGGYGEDRKNIANLVRFFIEEFHGRKDVGLVLKLNMARNSIIDYKHTLNRLKQIKENFKEEDVPPIHLIHGNLSDEEMSSLYNHPQIKSFVSFGCEGFGRPLLEAAACELPIIALNWSGHLDFLKKGKFSAVDYDLVEIPDCAVWENVLIKGSKWARVKEEDAKHRLRKMFNSYFKPQEWAQELGKIIREDFNLEVVCQNFRDVVKMSLLQAAGEKNINPVEHLQSFIDTPEHYNVVFTMPMSTGDVFISTAVIDGLIKELPKNSKIYFATQPQYFDVLENNPHVHKIIPWNQTMMNVGLLEEVFDLALTPNVTTQYNFSNWVRKGQSKRLLAEEFANHCQSELGEYFIKKVKPSFDLPKQYMTLHTTSGIGQWEGRKYEDWQEVVQNLKEYFPELKIIQVGSQDEEEIKNVDINLCGKTTIHEAAFIIDNSLLHLSPDTFTMHLASSLYTPLVAIFGCSSAMHTGPWVKDKQKAKFILLQSERLSGCGQKGKFCYKNRCSVNPDGNGPINEIDAFEIFQACVKLLIQEK